MWQLINMVTAQFTFVASLITILVSSVITTAIGWESYIIIILSSLPLFIVEFKFGNVTWHIWAENTPRMRMFDHVRYKFIHPVSNVQTKMLQNSNFLINKMRAILTSFRKDQYGVDNRRLFYSIGASIVAASGFGYVFYSITTQVVAGIITVGTMVFLINILGQLVGSISSMLTDIARQFERDLYVNDFFKVIDTKPYVPVSKHPIPLKLSHAPTIEFRNVWFKYDGTEKWILQGLNFKIKSGEKVALVGENGAGKSTLIKLLARIYDPSKGEILINNVDLRDIDAKEWLSYLAILLQDYVGYNFSIGESIAMGRAEEQVDSARAQEAAMLSGAHSFIAQYKKGYDQQVGKDFEEGIELSKGQNQRLALARIIYRRGYVMVLDEPTAAIDAKSEMEIFENMEKASGESTLVLITHRFNTTQNVDTIHVIEHGEIKESGNHKELLKHDGLYAEMFRAQAKSFLEDGTKHA
jgi:ATP-binding cassette subfamily B protein